MIYPNENDITPNLQKQAGYLPKKNNRLARLTIIKLWKFVISLNIPPRLVLPFFFLWNNCNYKPARLQLKPKGSPRQ